MRGSLRALRWLWIVPIIVTLALLVVPSVLVLVTSLNGGQLVAFPPHQISLDWYDAFFTNSAWQQAVLHSVEVCFGSAILSILVGTPASVALVRGRFLGQQVLRATLVAPLVMPTIVLGIGLYQIFAEVHLIGSVLGLTFAYTVLGVPLVILTVSAGLQTAGEDLERAARSLGAPPLVAFIRVTLPMITTSILAGGVFVIVAGLSEVVVASLLAGTSAQTLPLQMWLGLRFELNPVIPAASTVILLVVAAVLGVSVFAGNRRQSWRGE